MPDLRQLAASRGLYLKENAMLQASDQVPIPETAEPLARAYLDVLARTEGVSMRSMLKRQGSDELSEFQDLIEESPDSSAPTLRADLAAGCCSVEKRRTQTARRSATDR